MGTAVLHCKAFSLGGTEAYKRFQSYYILISGLGRLVVTVLEVKQQAKAGEERSQGLSAGKLVLKPHSLTNSHVSEEGSYLCFIDSVFGLLCKDKG